MRHGKQDPCVRPSLKEFPAVEAKLPQGNIIGQCQEQGEHKCRDGTGVISKPESVAPQVMASIYEIQPHLAPQMYVQADCRMQQG